MGRKKKGADEINASSMADIAFLLLIFFLVTTTIDVDKGILHKLPPFADEPPPDVKANKRNVLDVLVNANDYLLVKNEYAKPEELKDLTVKHLTNNGKDPNFSVSPEDAIVSLKNDRGTSYGMYITVQNALKAAYREVRDNEAAKETNGKFTYQELSDCAKDPYKKPSERAYCADIKSKVKEKYPMKISEAEPEDLVVGG